MLLFSSDVPRDMGDIKSFPWLQMNMFIELKIFYHWGTGKHKMLIEAQLYQVEFHLSLTTFGDFTMKFIPNFRQYNIELPHSIDF